MELTKQEQIDIYMAILARMSFVTELIAISKEGDRQEYLKEFERLSLLKNRFQLG